MEEQNKYEVPELTMERLNKFTPGKVFASGTVENSPRGVYMTDQNKGATMRWVAKRGAINDWAIYIHWAYNDEEYVMKYGDKVRDGKNIKKLVPCTDEVFKKYRY